MLGYLEIVRPVFNTLVYQFGVVMLCIPMPWLSGGGLIVLGKTVSLTATVPRKYSKGSHEVLLRARKSHACPQPSLQAALMVM